MSKDNTPVSPEPPEDTRLLYESVLTIRRNSWRGGWAEGYRAALVDVCAHLEKAAKEGYFGEDVDGDYLAAQTIREKFGCEDALPQGHAS